MKTIIGLLLFFLVQSADAQKPAFFRIYDANGKKVNKGNIYGLSDTSLTLTRRNLFVETPISQIHVIKSKRTTGHRVMMTALTVVGVGVILVGTVYSLSHRGQRNCFINSRPGKTRKIADKPTNEKVISPLKKIPKPQKKYKVNADVEKWQEQRKLLFYQRV
jgi:hypothetical protein